MGVLQAGMTDFWAQRLESASRFGYNFANISVHARDKQPAAPGQPQAAPIQRQRDRQSKSERTKRKQDWRARRDRKLSGRSAGPISEIAESRTKLPLQPDEVRGLKPSGKLSPHRIRTVQNTAGDEFSDGTPMMSTVRKIKQGNIKKGEEIPPIKVYRHENKLYTLDNRRLYAHRRANKPIAYKIAEGREAEEDFQRKFSSMDTGMSMKIVPSERSKVPYQVEDLNADSDEEQARDQEYASEEESGGEGEYWSDQEERESEDGYEWE